MLKIYNSLSRQKEEFRPIVPGEVRMYVCGMTVYDYCHLGHGRVMVVFDTVVRYLRARGYQVTYVRNITDIDDKIIRRAQENNEDFHGLTERFIRAMHEDAAVLGMQPPDFEPRASESIAAIARMTARLVEAGYAYTGENGDVYYAVNRFPGYGALSGKRTEDLRAGARVEINEAKRDPLDFVLWKAAKPGEPSWDSPWGAGRPGWHIECSAMSTERLGPHFDIHGGGQDLQFPHHENEIAQSEAATGEKFVNCWMHAGFVRINEEKMSKSLGNVFNVRDVLKRYHPEVVRYFLLSSHYRSPLNYSEEQLQQAEKTLTRLYLALRGLPRVQGSGDEAYTGRFAEAMDDDFNTPGALAVLADLAREVFDQKVEQGNVERAAGFAATLRELGNVLGLLQKDPEAFLQAGVAGTRDAVEGEPGSEPHRIELLIEQRTAARKRKQWAEADRIRRELGQRGVVLEDLPDGTTAWRRQQG
jgi:cysteinyl-tRNA synthetase